MKQYIVIGLGNFGLSLAQQLEENGCEVLGIDMSRELVEHAKDFLSHAVIGDATNKELLSSLSLKDFDGSVISIGQDMAPSTLIALYLKEAGAQNIIVRAVSRDHGKILEKIGVTEVLYPENEMAVKLANRLSMKNALDYLPLSDEHGILEVIPPKSFIGKDLKELQISVRFKCQVIAIKHMNHRAGAESATGDFSLKIPPSADDIITSDTIMIIIGKVKDIERIQLLT
ncbi:MAG TPA: TrkA family potassium uptake protein [Spirochaetota bacterium]|nr:TrkA family potassium uptake protein [Spirochaetota bacterium]